VTPGTETWLAPLLEALLADEKGSEAFGRLMEEAITDRMSGVDWIKLGQHMRNELGWEDYPALPSDIA
jgi:hypothetical protein